jgi:hypothetical protein
MKYINKKTIIIIGIVITIILISIILNNIISPPSSNIQIISEKTEDIRLEDNLLIKDVYIEELEEMYKLHMTISNDTKKDIYPYGYNIKIISSRNVVIHEFEGIQLDVISPNQEIKSYTEIDKSIDLSKAKKIIYEKIK